MFPDLTRDDVFRLETARLWLRWPRAQDAAAIARYAGDRAVAEMTGRIPHPYPPGAAAQFVLESRHRNANGAELCLVITPRSRPDEVIGVTGIHLRGGFPILGYWLGVPHWGKGFATEAAQALVDCAFSYGDFAAIQASARVVNPASRRVLEKCGFQFIGQGMAEAPARGGLLAVDYFNLPRSTFASLKGWREPRFSPSPSPVPSPAPEAEAEVTGGVPCAT